MYRDVIESTTTNTNGTRSVRRALRTCGQRVVNARRKPSVTAVVVRSASKLAVVTPSRVRGHVVPGIVATGVPGVKAIAGTARTIPSVTAASQLREKIHRSGSPESHCQTDREAKQAGQHRKAAGERAGRHERQQADHLDAGIELLQPPGASGGRLGVAGPFHRSTEVVDDRFEEAPAATHGAARPAVPRPRVSAPSAAAARITRPVPNIAESA